MEVEVTSARHCAFCQLKDFLPFECSECRKVFCLEHKDTVAHECNVDKAVRGTMPKCPVCSQFVKVTKNENVDAVVNQHILQGCKTKLMRNETKKLKNTKKRCGVCLNKKNYDTIVCALCRNQFCLTHRHPESHKCEETGNSRLRSRPPSKTMRSRLLYSMERTTKPKPKSSNSEKDAPLASQSSQSHSSGSSPKGKVNEGFASSVGSFFNSLLGSARSEVSDVAQPEKDKGAPKISAADVESKRSTVREKAMGDPNVSLRDRFCLEIHFPSKCPFTKSNLKLKPKSLFFDKKFTVGKAIDQICKRFPKLQNRNNEPRAKKLLLGHSTRASFPPDIPILLLEPELRNGDSVVIFYSPDP